MALEMNLNNKAKKYIKPIISIIIILIIGLSSLYAIYFKLSKPCYNAVDNFFDVFIQEGLNYSKLDQQTNQDYKDKLSKMVTGSSNKIKIPAITHHIYFTPEESSKKLNDFYNETMKATFSRLNNLNIEWNHYIWTNNPKIFPEDLKKINAAMDFTL